MRQPVNAGRKASGAAAGGGARVNAALEFCGSTPGCCAQTARDRRKTPWYFAKQSARKLAPPSIAYSCVTIPPK
jgi:hypothetical protein